MMKNLNLYIHIPFCKTKCKYCAFYSLSHLENLRPSFIQALQTEMETVEKNLKGVRIRTIYFGGGTPSELEPKAIDRLINKIKKLGQVAENAEVTLEANPESVTPDKLRGYLSAGVNRLSLGLQAGQDRLLSKMGRGHTAKQFQKIYAWSRQAGFKNINVDLIFGIPTQTFADWRQTLALVLDLQPEHISAYSLELNNRSVWGIGYKTGKITAMSQTLDRKMYHETGKQLAKAGYTHYEISNWAKPGYECRHNVDFWQTADYLGLGPGAYSCLNGKIRHNPENLSLYLSPRRAKPLTESVINPKNWWLALHLRLIKGFSLESYEKVWGTKFTRDYAESLREMAALKVMVIKNDQAKLTPKGWDTYDAVMRLFST